ncbi:glucoamylase family protein [Roseateles sp.]|uniref:glucoamylase family protein n=1 Tax=Roseateles sp. TaxID=1971397 RepID=UPI003936DF51
MTAFTRRAWLAQAAGLACAPQALAQLPARAEDAHKAFLSELERRTFDWFWDIAHPVTGLTPDRWPSPSFCSVAAVGFALSSYVIGSQRGYITRTQARDRTLKVLNFLAGLPQGAQRRGVAGHKGFFYHFLDMETGHRFAQCELSTVDTALLLMGALHSQAYFDGTNPPEMQIRRQVQFLVERVDWTWAQVRGDAISHGWLPESGPLAYDWRGYNEAMMVYLLALSSPTHPVGPGAWAAWTSTYDRSWKTVYGQQHLHFAPLFGHQFNHCWVDYRGLKDAELLRLDPTGQLDYFENTRRATYAQQAYARANPEGWAGYDGTVFGVTASDGPADVVREFGGRPRRFISYAGRGLAEHDDGTLAPYGAGSSLPFAPEIVIPALVAIRERHPHTWGRYGFFDAFNPSFTFTDVKLQHGRIEPGKGWVDTDYLGIDQGPLLMALANHQGELVWKLMREHTMLRAGLRRAGFEGGWLT